MGTGRPMQLLPPALLLLPLLTLVHLLLQLLATLL